MKAILIDNEPAVIQTLRIVLEENHPNINIVAEADSVEEGVEAIQTHKPDIVFLDIELNDGLGFEVLNQTDKSFNVIFITAHSHYALQAIKASALDYLLKPVAPSDLAEAISKAKQQNILKVKDKDSLKAVIQEVLEQKEGVKRIVLRDFERVYVVLVKDIIRCEADGKYTKFKLKNDPDILVSKNLKTYEDLLENSGFIRCHHSHIVQLASIKSFSKGLLELNLSNGETIPVSTRKKDALLQGLEGLS